MINGGFAGAAPRAPHCVSAPHRPRSPHQDPRMGTTLRLTDEPQPSGPTETSAAPGAERPQALSAAWGSPQQPPGGQPRCPTHHRLMTAHRLSEQTFRVSLTPLLTSHIRHSPNLERNYPRSKSSLVRPYSPLDMILTREV